MSVYDEKPWLSLYDPDQPAEISLEFTDALSMFRASVRRNPDGDIIRYFGGRITARELDELSDAFAVALAGLGVGRATGWPCTCRTCRSSSSACSPRGRRAASRSRSTR